jgi:hypothetical protein
MAKAAVPNSACKIFIGYLLLDFGFEYSARQDSQTAHRFTGSRQVGFEICQVDHSLTEALRRR